MMLELAAEERRAVLFLVSLGLVGMGLSFAFKVNSRIERYVVPGENFAKININRASLSDLVAAKVASEKLAAKIIAYRDTHGPFRDMEDLKEIKGIGDYRYERLDEVFYAE
ncbi:MAG: helix-hairpin-helix domain-containing protein [Candidatus Omnitrophota bacterium]